MRSRRRFCGQPLRATSESSRESPLMLAIARARWMVGGRRGGGTGQPAELAVIQSGVLHFSAFADGTVHFTGTLRAHRRGKHDEAALEGRFTPGRPNEPKKRKRNDRERIAAHPLNAIRRRPLTDTPPGRATRRRGRSSWAAWMYRSVTAACECPPSAAPRLPDWRLRPPASRSRDGERGTP